jgi:hypothetical protein
MTVYSKGALTALGYLGEERDLSYASPNASQDGKLYHLDSELSTLQFIFLSEP